MKGSEPFFGLFTPDPAKKRVKKHLFFRCFGPFFACFWVVF